MEDTTRKRVLRRLEALPEEQLYQVLDFIEFLEEKYAREAARKPDAFQQFAERIEDRMRLRSVTPRAMRGTMRVVSTAGKVIDGVRDLGRDLGKGLMTPPQGSTAPDAAAPAAAPAAPASAAPATSAPETDGSA